MKKTNLENDQRYEYMKNLVKFINNYTNIRVTLETRRKPDHITKLERIIKTEENK